MSLKKNKIWHTSIHILRTATKKPQPQGLEPGDGEYGKHTGPAATGKGQGHHIWWVETG